MADHPEVKLWIENSPKYCTYGGQVSVHISLAGKELLRYEALTLAVAEEYIEHIEYYQPRLNSQREWELVIFTDSGFQTLYLNAKSEPQCVMSHCRLDQQNQDTHLLLEKVLHARNLAARYCHWYERRGWYNTMRVYKLEAVLEVLNAVLREPTGHAADEVLNSYCSSYTVEKGVQQFSNRNKRTL